MSYDDYPLIKRKYAYVLLAPFIVDVGIDKLYCFENVFYVPKPSDNMVESKIQNGSKGKICTLNCSLNELAILQLIMENQNEPLRIESLTERKRIYSKIKWYAK